MQVLAPVVVPPAHSRETGGGLRCTGCMMPTNVAESQQYGKNPFVRRCNACVSSYRWRITMNRKDKAKHAEWHSMSGEQKTQWFRKQKRDATEKYRKRKPEYTEKEEDVVDRGRRAWDDMIPYETFWDRKTALGWSQQQIDDQWRKLLADEKVTKEEIEIDGQVLLCVAQFGGVQRYHDVKRHKASGVRATSKLDKAEDLQQANEMKAVWKQRLGDEGGMKHGFLLHGRHLPAEGNRDIKVSKVLGLVAGGFEGEEQLFAEVAADQKGKEEREKREALQEAVAAPAEAARAKRPRAAPGVTRTRISSRSTVDDICARLEETLREHKETYEAVKLSCAGLGDYGACWTGDLDKTYSECEAAGKAAVAATRALLPQVDKAETAEVLKGLVAQARDNEATFKREPAKNFVALVKTVRRKVASHENRAAKQLAAAAVVKTPEPKVECMVAKLEELLKGEHRVGDDTSLEEGQRACVYQVPGVMKVAEKVAALSYIGNLESFLNKYMGENALTAQTCAMNAAKVQSLVSAMHDCLPSRFVLSKPPAARQAPDNGAFALQLLKLTRHRFMGITNFGVGEAYLLLKGSVKVASAPVCEVEGVSLGSKMEHLEHLAVKGLAEAPYLSFTEMHQPGTIIAVPEGSVQVLAADDALVVRWGFGCCAMHQVRRTHQAVQMMLDEYPAVATATYVEWCEWLRVLVG